jgi:hypothetical protein
MIPATGSRGILQERCGKVTGSFRKTPEIAGTWKQYSDWKLAGFFPVDSCAFGQEQAGKNPKIFRPGYCFHKITGITRNRQFPDRVVRPGEKRLDKIGCNHKLNQLINIGLRVFSPCAKHLFFGNLDYRTIELDLIPNLTTLIKI